MRLSHIFLIAVATFLLNSEDTLAVAHTKLAHATELTVVDSTVSEQSLDTANKRFLRTSEIQVSTDKDNEERIFPGTEAAKKMITKLEVALHIKKAMPLAKTEKTEQLQFATWFLYGKKPSDVEKILGVSAVYGDGPLHSLLMRYVNYFSTWRFSGITFHV